MIYVVIEAPDLNLVQGLRHSEVVKCFNLNIMYRAGYKVHSSKFIISHLFPKLFCIIWGLFGLNFKTSPRCKMGNGKNRKKRGSGSSRGGKARLAGMSTPKQKPIYPNTRSITRAQHTQTILLATPIVPDDDEPQEVPTLLPDATVFNPANLRDLQGAHTLMNLHHTTQHQSLAFAQTPHERAEMEVMLDDIEADDDSEDDLFVEPSTSIWLPEANRTIGGSIQDDESAIFTQTPWVCTSQSNPARAPELLAISHTPATVHSHRLKKLKGARVKRRVALNSVVEEVQEGSSELKPHSVTMY